MKQRRATRRYSRSSTSVPAGRFVRSSEIRGFLRYPVNEVYYSFLPGFVVGLADERSISRPNASRKVG